MSKINVWLSDPHNFEIFKIILDKGLLAFILLLSGVGVSILLERYKSGLKKQEEVSKIIGPRILEVMAQSETLYEAGTRAIDRLEQQFSSFRAWADALFESDATAQSFKPSLAPVGTEILELPVLYPTAGTITIRELLDRTAPDDTVRGLLRRPDFLSSPRLYEMTGFLFVLRNFLSSPQSLREKGEQLFRGPLHIAVSNSVFVPMVRQPRRDYAEELNRFRLLVMRNVPNQTRRQERAFEKITNVLNILWDFIDTFPNAEVVEFAGRDPVSVREGLVVGHAAILSQLSNILAAL